ncbi:MAG: threonine ammonia-lyase [Desulfobacterales bacterium]|jgi:threonine dehydratase
MKITLAHIQAAAKRIHGDILSTPLVYSPALSQMFAGEIHLKMENLQKTGSFKARGAMNLIKARRDEIPADGVVTASAGNHAQGVALAARQADVPATIVMPVGSSLSKQEATRHYGGRVIIEGQTISESLGVALKLAREGRMFIHPFDDPLIIAGQGTMGLEILADLPDVDRVIAPVGGGGLIAGLAVALRALKGDVRMTGVQTAVCPSALNAIQKGGPVEVTGATSIADGIAVRKTGRLNFEVIREMVDQIVVVEEEQIAAAILLLMERKKIVAEGSGAVALAALMSAAVRLQPGEKTVLLISGGNLDSPLLGRIIRKGLIKSGRIMRLNVMLADIPGALAQLLNHIAESKANVLHIHHNRSRRDFAINMTAVELELETRGEAHTAELEQSLRDAGYTLMVC